MIFLMNKTVDLFSQVADITSSELEKCRKTAELKVFNFLADYVKKYTMNDSSSIPAELAEQLLQSVLFVLDIDENSPMERTIKLAEMNIEEEFEAGIKAIQKQITLGKNLWRIVCRSVPKIENQSLVDTLKSIQHFWSHYDFHFFAHEIPCDIDYQLSWPVPEELHGIKYLNEWLTRLLTENAFIKQFETPQCIRLLECFCSDYKGLLINLYEPIATNAVGLALTGGNIRLLTISETERINIETMFLGTTSGEGKELLREAANKVCIYFDMDSRRSKEYLTNCAVGLYYRIQAAINYHNLDHIFLTF